MSRSAASTSKCDARKRTSAATSVSCSSILSLPRLELRHVEQIVDVLEQHPRVARDDLRRTRAAAARRHRPVVVDQPLRGTEDQRERRPQLVADVGEELRLDLVELADALEQPLQLDVLLRDLALLRLLLGDVAPLGRR